MLQTPVAMLVFNRPDTTERVFARVAQARPAKLLVVGDGSRPGVQDESQRCAAVRGIIDRVDWACDVVCDFSEVNLGCKRRVSSGLSWVFEQVDRAIILEDDCVPDLSFFRFCDELLERYRDDDRVMAISGDNFQFGRRRSQYSYYFSRYNHVWGWASWRRAFRHYDLHMKRWPELRDGGWLRDILGRAGPAAYWRRAFDRAYRGEIDTWDYQWTFACWQHSGLTILPAKNLVSNIGFGTGATHTRRTNAFADMPAVPMMFPLQHPPFLIRDSVSDARTERIVYNSRPVRAIKTLARRLWR